MQPTANNHKPSPINAGFPSWLPPSVKDKIQKDGNVIYVGSFSKGDKKIMRTRRPIKPSKWTEKHRTVTMSVINGPWRNDVTPYLTGIMDAAAFPSVRDLDICKAPQTGVSEAAHNYVGYSIDMDHGPVLYTYPDERTGIENFRDRLLPMIKSSLRLKSYMTEFQDDASSFRIALSHMPLYLAWARSASRLGNKPIKIAISDEIDKYTEPPKREASSLDLIDKRLITYKKLKKSKHWKISTPTWDIGHIWRLLTEDAEVVFDFYVRCLSCGAQQLMNFEQIKWPRDKKGNHPDPKSVKSNFLAWYECPHCNEKWNDDVRDMTVRNDGEWRARPENWASHTQWREKEPGLELFEYLNKYMPVEIGFHIPSWISYFVSLSETAASFLKWIKTKNKDRLKDFRNSHEAMPFTDYPEERSEDAILALRDDRLAGLVPSGEVVAAITGAIDTQDNGFIYELRGWSYGLIQESWQIRKGFVSNFTQLDQILFDDVYMDVDGVKYLVRLSVIDSGGHRTSEVYDWCRVNRGRVFPLKGEQRMNQPIAWSKIDVYPGTTKPIPGGIKLVRVNTTYFKNKLANMLEIAPADPGAWHMHSEMSEDWARQMTSEYVDEKGIWQVRQSMANHAWDVSGYGLACAEILGIRFWQKKKQKKEAKKPKLPGEVNGGNGRRW